MNAKVKELVERVRLEYSRPKAPSWMSEECRSGYVLGYEHGCQAQLNEVLNDPDLALIDREKQRKANPYFTETHIRALKNPPIIPLAEALRVKQ